MQLNTAFEAARRSGVAAKLPITWRQPIARLALVWTAIFALTFRDWAAMAHQWWNISTYNHVLFVPLIVAWLVYARRHALSRIVPTAWAPGLLLVGGALFVWLLGSLAGVNSVSQLGAVAALQMSVFALLGPRVAAANLFPLCYMIFLVPFGDELVPAMQMITAELVIGLTHLSGIAAVIDGVFIDTPAGLFEVAEACSGVKFLIAMIALGVLVSYSCFTRWKRRAAFMTSAIGLSIIANGIRAWGTIYIAQFQGVEFAAGFDHIFYGWIFFALIVGGLLAVSWRWFDRDPDQIGIDCDGIERKSWFIRTARFTLGGNAAVAALSILLIMFSLWHMLASQLEARVPEQIHLPAVSGWALVDYAPQVGWEPKAGGADHRLLGRYRNAQGAAVDVFLAVYAAQEEGREASAFGEGALDPATDWRWLAPAASRPNASADYIMAFGTQKRLVETSYRTGELVTGSAARLKLANMRDRLLLRKRPTILLILSAEQNDNPDPARSVAQFRQSIGNDGEWMDRVAGLR